ncbi:threonylcarbamoyl-AMP synthase [Halobacillus fulvus]|nr:threonylcarbamoyl-AMP synthase [Halobacillus fulvus]
MEKQTKLWKPAEYTQDHPDIVEAANALKAKDVVAFPTETVYGLGADATNEEAVQRIFDAKGRPADNPLIVHVADQQQVGQLVTHIPEVAQLLMDTFWPGPLTLILESNGTAAQNVTAGLSTVGIRMPEHPLALALLKAVERPLAAPSANRSGRPSPTAADHVIQDLDGRIAGILDGGATGVGLESTVLDCTSDVPVILRPGGITKEKLEQVLPEVRVDPSLLGEAGKPKSPGMKYTHYAPEAPLWLIDGNDDFFMEQLNRYKSEGNRVGVIASDELLAKLDHEQVISCGSRKKVDEIAGKLYHALREFKRSEVDLIFAETFDESGVGAAVMNRLRKASVKVLESH